MKFIEESIDLDKYEAITLFISYEERSLSLAKDLYTSRYNGKIYSIFCDDLPLERTQPHLDEIKQLFKDQVNLIPVSFNNPLPAIRAASRLDWSRSMLIDISCFNRGNLFPFFWSSGLGKTVFPDLGFVYTAPNNYGNWLSSDYEEPKNIIGFAGGHQFAKDRLLICAVGFEAERAISVIQAAEPSKVILTVGTVPTREEFCNRNQRTVEDVHGSKNYNICDINVSDPTVCIENLKSIIRNESAETEIHFAPFSTKISCLGIWALWLNDNNIRIWNAQPNTYNILNYSKGMAQPRYFRVVW